MIRRICVIGPTQTGTGIAQIAAATGFDITLTGASRAELDEGVKIMKRNLKMDHVVRKMSTKKQNEHIEAVLARIPMTTDLIKAVRDADLVVEAVEETTGAKQDRFRDLEKIVSDETILAHQTSSQSLGTLTVAKYAEKMEQKSRFLGVQFYNAVARNVKVIKCLPTDQNIFEKIDEWGENMGKETVRCIDTPDFIVEHGLNQPNSTKTVELFPYMMKALRKMEETGLDTNVLDVEMSKEANLPIGPFQLMDYIGLDTVEYIIQGWHRFRPDKELYFPSDFVSKKVQAGHFGQKTGQGVYKY